MAQFNLLIHGNAQGASLWCNKTELPNLSQEEHKYVTSFYTSSGENKSTVSFVIDWRTDEVTGKMISYYHYVVQGNVSEAGGRASGYVALTLRISEAIKPSLLLLVYDILRRLFEEKAVGKLVDKTEANGYKFRVAKLEELDATFRQWEEDLAKEYGSALSFQESERVPEKQGKEMYFSLDDLWRIQASSDQLTIGDRLVFSSTKPSLQSTSQVKKLKEEINNLRDENNNLNEEMAKQRTVAKNKHDQLEQQNRTLSDKQARLNSLVQQMVSTMGGVSSSAPHPHRATSPLASNNPSTGMYGEERYGRKDAVSGLNLQVILLALLLALLLASQVYVIWNLPSSSEPKDSESLSSSPQIEVMYPPAKSDVTKEGDEGTNASISFKSSGKPGENQGGSSEHEADKKTPDHDASLQKYQPSSDKK